MRSQKNIDNNRHIQTILSHPHIDTRPLRRQQKLLHKKQHKETQHTHTHTHTHTADTPLTRVYKQIMRHLLGLPPQDDLPNRCIGACNGNPATDADHFHSWQKAARAAVIARHDAITTAITSAAKTSSIHALTYSEPALGAAQQRADALISLSSATLVIDVSVVHPNSPGYRAQKKTSQQIMHEREQRKRHLYQEDAKRQGLHFIPVVIDTYGKMAAGTIELLTLLAEEEERLGGARAPQAFATLRTKVLKALHKGNAFIRTHGSREVRSAYDAGRGPPWLRTA